MSEPYVGEIRMAGFNFVPADWLACNGQLLSISQYETLFTLIGTTYGGDGQTTFALPNLQGRIPMHQGSGFPVGQQAGEETVTLGLGQIPAHSHTLNAQSAQGGQGSPVGNVWAASPLDQFSSVSPVTTLSASALGYVGGNQAHDNLPPFLVVNYIIAPFGVYPSQS
jgi:microcystin-dependent protein